MMKRVLLGLIGTFALGTAMADFSAADRPCCAAQRTRSCDSCAQQRVRRIRRPVAISAPVAPVCNTVVAVSETTAAEPPAAAPAANVEEGFKVIFDGTSLDGWKTSTENPEAWKLVDGTLVANGERSHMFYVGDDQPFVNFELKVDCKAANNSNGGIYIRTKYQEVGWPKYGHEAQVNNSYEKDPKKSGSLYGIVDVTEQHIADDTWWTETVTVVGRHITIKLNDKVVVDYEEPEGKEPFSADFERRLGEGGTFALQAHDPHSTIAYKNIRVKRLP